MQILISILNALSKLPFIGTLFGSFAVFLIEVLSKKLVLAVAFAAAVTASIYFITDGISAYTSSLLLSMPPAVVTGISLCVPSNMSECISAILITHAACAYHKLQLRFLEKKFS